MEKIKKPKGNSYYGNRSINYERRRKKQDWWHVEQREMHALLEILPRGLKVVDIPFGTGRFVPIYKELEYDVHGLDASDHMLDAAKVALGDLYDRCKTRVGDAAALPYADREFDLLVSTRFLRDIVTFRDAKTMLAEMARVTDQFAIIQLGENPTGNREPREDEVMGSHLSREMVDKLLKGVGLRATDRRLVKENVEGGDIHGHDQAGG